MGLAKPGTPKPAQKPAALPVMGPKPIGPVPSPNGISITSFLFDFYHLPPRNLPPHPLPKPNGGKGMGWIFTLEHVGHDIGTLFAKVSKGTSHSCPSLLHLKRL
jgi:hypothetical protein